MSWHTILQRDIWLDNTTELQQLLNCHFRLQNSNSLISKTEKRSTWGFSLNLVACVKNQKKEIKKGKNVFALHHLPCCLHILLQMSWQEKIILTILISFLRVQEKSHKSYKLSTYNSFIMTLLKFNIVIYVVCNIDRISWWFWQLPQDYGNHNVYAITMYNTTTTNHKHMNMWNMKYLSRGKKHIVVICFNVIECKQRKNV